jgi:hypothetical protein
VAETPIEGQVQLIAAAKASVPPQRVPELLNAVQADLAPRLDDYRRQYELVEETPEACTFLVPPDHWVEVGGRLGFERREIGAVRRAHEAQLRRMARREDRREEFETALEIRTAVVVGVGSDTDR